MPPVKIPASLVPSAPVDYDAEAHQILGHSLVLSDGFRVPPLTAARLVALEITSSPFFMDPHGCGVLDAAAAVVLLTCSRELCEELAAGSPVAAPGSAPAQMFPRLYDAAASWLAAHAAALEADYGRIADWITVVPFYGFAMRPDGPPARPKAFIFDGAYIGGVIAPAAHILSTPVDAVMWDTPLCLVGHAVAQHDASLGVKGVGRRPDIAALDRMAAEAEAREESGELHPWQYADPLNYPLTDRQAQANPALIGRMERITALFKANGCRPVAPDLVSAASDSPAPSASTAERTAAVKDLSLYVAGLVQPVGGEDGPAASSPLAVSASAAEPTVTVEEHPHV